MESRKILWKSLVRNPVVAQLINCILQNCGVRGVMPNQYRSRVRIYVTNSTGDLQVVFVRKKKAWEKFVPFKKKVSHQTHHVLLGNVKRRQ